MQLKKQIILTGGSCSGKTTISELIKPYLNTEYKYIPEIATWLLSNPALFNFDISNMNDENRKYFQTKIMEYQIKCEKNIIKQNMSMFQDRGILDGAAYLKGGISEMENILNNKFKTSITELTTYDGYNSIVILLSPPDRKTYNAFKNNNPVRYEDYDQTMEYFSKLKTIYKKYYHGIIEYNSFHKGSEFVVNSILSYII